jgi:hypothetical protein
MPVKNFVNHQQHPANYNSNPKPIKNPRLRVGNRVRIRVRVGVRVRVRVRSK